MDRTVKRTMQYVAINIFIIRVCVLVSFSLPPIRVLVLFRYVTAGRRIRIVRTCRLCTGSHAASKTILRYARASDPETQYVNVIGKLYLTGSISSTYRLGQSNNFFLFLFSISALDPRTFGKL